jgi:hypothetical protein
VLVDLWSRGVRRLCQTTMAVADSFAPALLCPQAGREFCSQPEGVRRQHVVAGAIQARRSRRTWLTAAFGFFSRPGMRSIGLKDSERRPRTGPRARSRLSITCRPHASASPLIRLSGATASDRCNQSKGVTPPARPRRPDRCSALTGHAAPIGHGRSRSHINLRCPHAHECGSHPCRASHLVIANLEAATAACLCNRPICAPSRAPVSAIPEHSVASLG